MHKKNFLSSKIKSLGILGIIFSIAVGIMLLIGNYQTAEAAFNKFVAGINEGDAFKTCVNYSGKAISRNDTDFAFFKVNGNQFIIGGFNYTRDTADSNVNVISDDTKNSYHMDVVPTGDTETYTAKPIEHYKFDHWAYQFVGSTHSNSVVNYMYNTDYIFDYDDIDQEFYEDANVYDPSSKSNFENNLFACYADNVYTNKSYLGTFNVPEKAIYMYNTINHKARIVNGETEDLAWDVDCDVTLTYNDSNNIYMIQFVNNTYADISDNGTATFLFTPDSEAIIEGFILRDLDGNKIADLTLGANTTSGGSYIHLEKETPMTIEPYGLYTSIDCDGYVTDKATGNPIANSKVVIKTPTNTFEAVTDANGYYYIKHLDKECEWEGAATADGYLASDKKVISVEETTGVDIVHASFQLDKQTAPVDPGKSAPQTGDSNGSTTALATIMLILAACGLYASWKKTRYVGKHIK